MNPALRAIGMLFGYFLTIKMVGLVALTLITSLYLQGSDKDTLQKVNEVTRSSSLLCSGIAAVLFITALQLLYPLTRTRWAHLLGHKRLMESAAVPALTGATVVGGFVLGATLGGYLSILGLYVQMDELVVATASLLVALLGFLGMALVEEFILRECLEKMVGESTHPKIAVVISTLAFLAIKHIQFELIWIEVINLSLLNLILSRFASQAPESKENGFIRSTTFLWGFYALAFVFFGLPFLGQEMAGVLLVRPLFSDTLGQLLIGGSRGPVAGFILTVILTITLVLPEHWPQILLRRQTKI